MGKMSIILFKDQSGRDEYVCVCGAGCDYHCFAHKCSSCCPLVVGETNCPHHNNIMIDIPCERSELAWLERRLSNKLIKDIVGVILDYMEDANWCHICDSKDNGYLFNVYVSTCRGCNKTICEKCGGESYQVYPDVWHYLCSDCKTELLGDDDLNDT